MHHEIIVLAESEALSSILTTQLRNWLPTCVHSANDVETAVNICDRNRVGVLFADICLHDRDISSYLPDLLARSLVEDFRTIGLTTKVDKSIKKICERAMLDEVIIKPASPLFFAERAQYWLEQQPVSGRARRAGHHLSSSESRSALNILPFPKSPLEMGS